ncbi:winged helix-turn-helix transcriptional regulator [Larkinella knui]|uniref:Transcriptional regulator n=1 Tax=Larkinella knui TaxID=2025310 RepID=A0A3P1CH41_9BACT|nr:helix-turn-helix domain-containing protein [Larkinella knui]RRB12585.1 transcriptional regulator [Larkinella knui]
MKNKVAETKAMCAVDYAFQRMGGKYKARILFHLGSGLMRYGALRKSMPDITPKMLTQALRELEGDELISRKVYHEVPPKVEYQLTPVGTELIPSIGLLCEWGKKQMTKKNLPIVTDFY